MKACRNGIKFGLAMLMVIAMLAGCGSKGPETTETAPAVASTEEVKTAETDAGDGPFGKYADPVTISVVKDLGQAAQMFKDGDSLEDNVWTRYFEDAFNIKFNWIWSTTSEQYSQKVNITITSNDLPDIMKVSAAQMKMMVDNGQAHDLSECYENYASDFAKEVLTADGGASLDSATFDGQLMAIPHIVSDLQSAYVLWIRQDWLDALGLEYPKTVEEFYEVADAFTHGDPDGNGVDDTYALGLNKDLYNTGFAGIEGFFNMYNAYPNIWIEKDGKLAYGSIQPEAKDAVAALQDMYEKGYVDPEFGVKDAQKVSEDINAGKIGMFFGNFWNMAWLNDAKVADPTFEFIPVAIPGGASAQIPFGTTEYYMVSAGCEHPEAAFKLLNGYLEKIFGETAEPTVYNITPDGLGAFDYPVIEQEPPMKNFEAAERVSAAIESKDPSGLNEEQKNYYDMSLMSLDGDHTNNNWHQLKMFGPGGSLTVIKQYQTDGKIVADKFAGAPTESMTEKKATLDKQQLTDYSAIIMGDSVDEFENFVKNWLKLGGEDITNEVNEWYSNK